MEACKMMWCWVKEDRIVGEMVELEGRGLMYIGDWSSWALGRVVQSMNS